MTLNFSHLPSLAQTIFYVPLLRSGKKGLRKDTLCGVRARGCHSCSASGKMCVSFACVKTSTGYVPVTTQR